MRTSSTLLLACLFVARVTAQELTSGQASFLPGENYSVYDGPPVPAGAGGAGVTWDFSSFSFTNGLQLLFMDPANTSYGGQFPTSTVALTAGIAAWDYFRGDEYVYEQLGTRSSDLSVNCPSGITLVPYPLAYGNGVFDEIICDGVAGGETFTRLGGLNVQADGYGDIIMPYGTVNNVLRIRWEGSYLDSGMTINDYGYADNYIWYKPGVHIPVLGIYHFESFVVVTDYTRMADQYSIGIQEALKNDIGIELYPNPATRSVSVVLGAKGRLRIDLIDGMGKTARSVDLGYRVPGIQKEEVSLEGLAPGPYTVRVTDDRGGSGTQRLVVQ